MFLHVAAYAYVVIRLCVCMHCLPLYACTVCYGVCVYNSKGKRRTEGEADSTKARESQRAFVPICMLISMSYWESNAGQQVNSSYPSVILMACLPGQFDSSVRELISPHVQWASTASSDLLLKTSLHPLSMRRHTHGLSRGEEEVTNTPTNRWTFVFGS